MRRRAWAVAVGICIPPLLLFLFVGNAAGLIGTRVGLQSYRWAALLQRWLRDDSQPPVPLPQAAGAAEIAALRATPQRARAPERPAANTKARRGTAAGSAADTTAATRPAGAAKPAAATRGVLIRRKRVLAAARAGIRPTGARVGKTAQHPAGVALHGVNALGVGLRDGDVLTSIEGRPIASPNMVVALAAGALRSGAPAISGEVWRGNHRLLVTVELPRLRQKRKKAPTQ